ncbi:MAG: penicillin-binding protein activator LpoB [Bacteroidales bacterium]|jgi:uncharacterized protein (TIGR02722 family)|nr:penicillin-binding protein activator LpoB [Bacteroidales bacterium]
MKSIARFSTIALVAVLILGGCSRSIKRVDPSTQSDLSGRWNDTDSRVTAEALIEEMFGNSWAVAFEQQHKRKPVIVVGLVNNKTHEHISTETYIKDLEKAIVKNGSIRLVQAGEKREELRRERAGQQEFASPETTKKWGRELGADFMLQGVVNAIVDSYKKDQSVYYQTDLELTNIETTEIVWMGDHKIKKMIRN